VSEPRPVYRTGVLWVTLAIFLVLGSVGAAFVIFGVTDLVADRRYVYDVAAIGLGGFGALFAFLMMTGILYRVDRLRGVPHRRVELFE
jgi:hypothetical protein